MEQSLTVRDKDAKEVREAIYSVRRRLEKELVDKVERNDMESDVENARTWAKEADELFVSATTTPGSTFTGSTGALEEVARLMLLESVELVEAMGSMDPPEWDRLDTALEDAAWWAKTHEQLYRAELANKKEVAK